MTRRIALVLALALASLAAEPVLAQQADTYVVQPGDTLFRISRANGLTVEALRTLNDLEDNYITVGQTLRLTNRAPQGQPPRLEAPDPPPGVGEAIPERPTPDAPAPRGGASSGLVHVVTAGETLFRIALRYDTSVDDLRRLNGITGDQIEIGQRLVVGGGGVGAPVAGGPVPIGPPRAWSINETTVAADLVHFVEPGETLYSIAAALRIDVDALARLNALSTAPLAPGTMLRLPLAVNPAVASRADLRDPDESGLALVYPDVMRGRPTESGEAYDPLAFTVSHRTLPFGTVVLVTNPTSGRSTFARVTDRGPVSRSYLIELSAAAATALELDPNAARRVDLREVR
ncbi:LysM peptidoglycan-binding domain-containing protein [Rubrivirga sp. IMCC43871]|uniref:LysM peptidoglycan-binding domain-containing protein n=1 Tax=Rubrivirga sp. IMCC43871 TaxID=3391575 RepID=UPI0039900611